MRSIFFLEDLQTFVRALSDPAVRYRSAPHLSAAPAGPAAPRSPAADQSRASRSVMRNVSMLDRLVTGLITRMLVSKTTTGDPNDGGGDDG
eukprot:3754683-Prymnesium_polylepis.1